MFRICGAPGSFSGNDSPRRNLYAPKKNMFEKAARVSSRIPITADLNVRIGYAACPDYRTFSPHFSVI